MVKITERPSDAAVKPKAKEKRNPAHARIASPMHAPMHSRAEKGAVRSKRNVRRLPLKIAMMRRTDATNMGQRGPSQLLACREIAVKFRPRKTGFTELRF